MPNTLAHIGIQALVTRAIVREADPKWIYVGCIVPDLPWILQRAARELLPEVSAYDLRLYAIVQSSLFMCLAISGALSLFSTSPRRVFAILALGSLLHLLLDALQKKWANGVHLFAPFDWELLNFGLFWPEDFPTDVMTGLGLLFFLVAWLRVPCGAADLTLPRGRALVLAGVLVPVYVFGPILFLSGPEAADNHSVKTLRAIEERPGRAVAFDRVAYLHRASGDRLRTFAGEELAVEGGKLDRSARVSVRGRFVDARTVEIVELHLHRALARDLASYLALALVLAYWMRALRPGLLRWIRDRRGTRS